MVQPMRLTLLAFGVALGLSQAPLARKAEPLQDAASQLATCTTRRPAAVEPTGNDPCDLETSLRVERLLEALADSDPRVRLGALAHLGRALPPRIALPLAARGLRDESAEVREEAVHALADLDDPRCLDYLAKALLDPDVDVRSAAVDSLVGFGDRALELLVFSLGDADPSIREDAAYALGALGGPGARRALERATGDDDASVREAADEALSELR